MKKAPLIFHIRVDNEIQLVVNKTKYATSIFTLINEGRTYLSPWLPWVSGVLSRQNTIDYLRINYEKYLRGDGFAAVILYKGKAAGMIGLEDFDPINKSASIGYWIGQQFQGRGIMIRSCKTMMDYSFYELEMNRLQIKCMPGNYKSRAIPIKLGFSLEGIFREVQLADKHFRDLAIYSMLRSEWPSISI